MNVKIHPSWAAQLQSEFDAPYFKQLTDFVRHEYAQGTCYPPGNEIFNAFNLCPFSQVKVVIIGQDPYHGPGQAEGLCFSVKDGVRMPPSLVNIFKEIEADTRHRKFATLGRTRRAAAQRHPHRARAPSRLACRSRLGDIYRCRHTPALCPARAPRIHTLGQLCTKERPGNRPLAPPCALLGTPLAPVGLPRLFWQSPLHPVQRLPYQAWHIAY